MSNVMRFYLIALCTLLFAPATYAAGEVVVYSARNEHLIKPLFDAYSRETGVAVRYLTDQAEPLLARLQAEGRRTPADLLITVDAGNLWRAGEAGVLLPVDSDILERNVPEHLRDPQNRWFGLSGRVRTIVYSRARVDPSELDTYAGLADPKWRGRLCLRSSKKVYNQSLVAMLINRHGEAVTEEIVRGWVANLALQPFADDNKVLQAIAAQQCDVGIVNSYYFGRLQRDQPDTDLALFWPDQQGKGVHLNVSGAGVTRHAPHREQATDLLEWLSTRPAQVLFARLNMEYPVNPKVFPERVVGAWGRFKADDDNIALAGRLQIDAIRLMDRAGYR